MKRQLVSCLSCLILLLTLILVPGMPVQAVGVTVYDTATYCNVPAANPGDPAYSEMAVEQNTLGFGCQYVSGIQLAETFILDAAATIGSVELFAYQTGSSTTPTFTGAYLAIYDGNPADGASILWGDMVTNRFESAAFTGCYRVSYGATDTQRPIMKIVADVSTESSPGLELAAGTYWLAFSLDGSLFSGPWGVPNILNTPYTAGTAIQYYTGNWQATVESGTGVQASIPLRLLAVEKQPQAAPDAPVVTELTDTSVTLEAIAGAAYKLDDGDWQASPMFTGLAPNTTYSFFARLAETETHLASPESAATTVTTPKSAQAAPDAPVVAELTDTGVTMEAIAGAEYKLVDGAWQADPVFTGLAPNTTYSFFARLAETATLLASPESAATTVTTPKSAQTAPDAPVVAELTDTGVTLEAIAGAEYKLVDGAWQADPVFTGLAPNTTYSFFARLAETATLLASPESAATTVTTLKSAQTAPAAPVVAELTDTSVTLEAIAGAAYKLDDGDWQASPTFTGLAPNTTYSFYARLAETETQLASPASAATTVTTLKSAQTAPAAPVVAELTDIGVTLEAIAGAAYKLDDGAWQDSPTFTGLAPNTAYSFYARLAETETQLVSPASAATTVTTLKSAQTAPAAPVVAERTDIGVTLEAIAGAAYKLDGGAWQISPVFTGLAPNTAYIFYARLAETETLLASPESAATTVTTPKSAQTAPAAPVAASITETAVTLERVAGAEYRLADGTWQTSPIFTGLVPDTTYRFYARLAETATHLASPDSVALQISLEMPTPSGEQGSWPVLALVGLALIGLAAARIRLRIRQKQEAR